MYPWCMYPWSLNMIHACMMHISILIHVTMMHLCMMHLSMMLDPDTCMYEPYIYVPWSSTLMHVHVSMMRQILLRTDGQGNSRSLIYFCVFMKSIRNKPNLYASISNQHLRHFSQPKDFLPVPSPFCTSWCSSPWCPSVSARSGSRSGW